MAETTQLTADTDAQIQQTPLNTIQDVVKRRRKYIYIGIGILLLIVLIIIIVVAVQDNSSSSSHDTSITKPVVLVTWGNTVVCDVSYEFMMNSTTDYQSLDGAVKGVQFRQSQNTIGADPDSRGGVTQSAMVIYGPKMETGAVAGLYDIDDAVGVAKNVLIYTRHALLVGRDATNFALQNGFSRTNFSNTDASQKYADWKNQNCQPRFWRNVKNGNNCDLIDGMYNLDTESSVRDITGCDANETGIEPPMMNNDDSLQGVVTGSIAVIALDEKGEMSLATSSNGQRYEIAGRVSDAAIPGAGGYIDPNVGGCVSTGSGDELIRFAPSRTAVTYMKMGFTPSESATKARDEVYEYCPGKQIIVICLSKNGVPGSSGDGYAYRSAKCTQAVPANPDHPRGTCT